MARALPPLLVITGPTAAGKTELAVRVARQLGSEIISADSMQVYRHLAIGTARPTEDELAGVRCHLTGHVEPDQQYHAGAFLREAEASAAALHAARRIPIVCGGTGLYIKALLEGLAKVPPPDHEVRARLARLADDGNLAQLHADLRRVDPGSSHIKPSDRQRILRALEVFYTTGQPLSWFHAQQAREPRYDALVVCVDRPVPALDARIAERAEAMVRAGLFEEAAHYLARGFARDNPAVKALGYEDLFAALDGTLTGAEAVASMVRKTRQYAKRQRTWLRKTAIDLRLDASAMSSAEAANHVLTALKERGWRASY